MDPRYVYMSPFRYGQVGVHVCFPHSPRCCSDRSCMHRRLKPTMPFAGRFMMTSSNGSFSALLAFCAGNSPVPDEFPAQRPVTRSFEVFFDLRPNKRLGKQSWGWWSETPSSSLWRHRNVHDLAHCKKNQMYRRNPSSTKTGPCFSSKSKPLPSWRDHSVICVTMELLLRCSSGNTHWENNYVCTQKYDSDKIISKFT